MGRTHQVNIGHHYSITLNWKGRKYNMYKWTYLYGKWEAEAAEHSMLTYMHRFFIMVSLCPQLLWA